MSAAFTRRQFPQSVSMLGTTGVDIVLGHTVDGQLRQSRYVQDSGSHATVAARWTASCDRTPAVADRRGHLRPPGRSRTRLVSAVAGVGVALGVARQSHEGAQAVLAQRFGEPF